jgi:hypothetical protein
MNRQLENTSIHCGSWLASEGGLAGDISIECTGLFVGTPPGASPLPH